MFIIKNMIAVLAVLSVLSIGGPAIAQNNAADLGEGLMSMDGSAGPGTTAVTGWNICQVIRTGAGWGNHYVALTCSAGPFTNKWHILNSAQKDAMLATALAAITNVKNVQAYIASAASGYNQIRAIYIVK